MPKEKTYQVTLTDFVQWTDTVVATSKKEAISKALAYVRDGSVAWRIAKTETKAEIVREVANDRD